MKIVPKRRLCATAFALALAVLIGGASYISVAQGSTLVIHGDGAAPCNGDAAAPAAAQGKTISFDLKGYRGGEAIALYFTFPDGRFMDLYTANSLDGPVSVANTTLPGILKADEGGDLFFEYTTSTKWPTGCYAVTTMGLSSGKTETTYLALSAKPAASPSGDAMLSIEVEGEQATTATADKSIKMFGSGFGAGEKVSVSIKAPSGAQAGFPNQPITSMSGEFTVNFKFNQSSLPGKYSFTAVGMTTDHTATADFALIPSNMLPSGGELTVFVTENPLNQRSHRVEIQGQHFTPYEGVTLQLHIPRSNATPPPPGMFGMAQDLPPLYANAQGKFATSIDITLNEQFSAGNYQVTAVGTVSGKTAVKGFKIPPASLGEAPAPKSTTPTTPTAPTVTPGSTIVPPTTPPIAATPVPSSTTFIVPPSAATATPATDPAPSPTEQAGMPDSGDVVIVYTDSAGQDPAGNPDGAPDQADPPESVSTTPEW